MTRIGLAGLGHWGKNWARTLHQEGMLAALCDADPSLLAATSEQYPDATTFSTYEALLNSNVDGVVLATPPPFHAPMAIQAMGAGKDVLVEKPMATSAAAAEEMARTAERHDRILMVGHVFLYNPGIRALKKAMDDGDIGAVRRIECTRHSLGIVRPEVDVIWNLAPHDVSIICDLANQEVAWVQGTGQSWLQPGVVDVAEIEVGFPDGLQAHISVSWMSPHRQRETVIIGDSGMMIHDDAKQDATHLFLPSGYKRLAQGLEKFAGPVRLRHHSSDPPLVLEARAFDEAIRTRREPYASATGGVAVVRVLEAISRSVARGGERVALSPRTS